MGEAPREADRAAAEAMREWEKYVRAPPPKQWQCDYCGSVHPETEFRCESCGAPRARKLSRLT
jgi:rubrerythrin